MLGKRKKKGEGVTDVFGENGESLRVGKGKAEKGRERDLSKFFFPHLYQIQIFFSCRLGLRTRYIRPHDSQR